MQRFLIITINCVLLAFLLIGLPAATREQWGSVQLSSASTGKLLMFWGLGIAAAANILAGLILVKGSKQKFFCWEWAGVFGVLLAVYYGFTRSWFNFEWLKHALQWLQNHL
jgi:hypothetical protein